MRKERKVQREVLTRRQAYEASKVARERPVENGVVAKKATSFGGRKIMANSPCKIHDRKYRNVDLHLGKRFLTLVRKLMAL